MSREGIERERERDGQSGHHSSQFLVDKENDSVNGTSITYLGDLFSLGESGITGILVAVDRLSTNVDLHIARWCDSVAVVSGFVRVSVRVRPSVTRFRHNASAGHPQLELVQR